MPQTRAIVACALIASGCSGSITQLSITPPDTTTTSTTAGSSTGSSSTGGTGTTSTASTTGGSTTTSTTGGSTTTSTSGSTTTGSTSSGSTTTGGIGTPTYTLGINLQGATGGVSVSDSQGETLTFSSDGNQIFTKTFSANASYSYTFTSVPAGRGCGFDTLAAGLFPEHNVTVNARCAVAATLVIGQANFNIKTDSLNYSSTSINGPAGNGIMAGSKFLFADTNSHRLLGFNAFPTTNGQAADFVVGQDTFSTADWGTGTSQFNFPEGLATNGTEFAVADTYNDRVMIYPIVPTANANSTIQLSGTLGTDSCRLLLDPPSVWMSNSQLLVPDPDNARVLIYNSLPTSNNQFADIVLGQPDNNTCSGADTTASTLDSPGSVWTDGTHVIVADTGNNRVLIWNTFPIASGQAADVVVGQVDMVSNASTPSSSSFAAAPTWVTSDGTHLVVSDYTANRVLIWNSLPTTNGVAADAVLGEPTVDDSSSACFTTSSATLCQPTAVAIVPGGVLVTDTGNERLLLFSFP